ncbi:MAG TPA: hypothetical protein DCO75_10890, partial [Fibrobacteres bacterium]|nr:hypothetical protein [Fibrobacterota bacterium]
MNIQYPVVRHVDEYRPVLFAMIFLCFFVPAWCASDKNDKKPETEAFTLHQLLDQTRDSLQNDIAARWKAKQGFVEQRENDKEELLRLKEIQEKAYSELERVKEECFSGAKMAEDAVAANATKVEEWHTTLAALDEILTMEAEAVSGVFPLDLETRRNDIENLRRQFRKKQDAASTLNGFAGYAKKYLAIG